MMGMQVGGMAMTLRHRTLYIFPGFILAIGTAVLNGCGGVRRVHPDPDPAHGNGTHLLACRWNLHDGANRHHLRRHCRCDDLLHK